MELIDKLGIDWRILVAQIVNFFLLLLILYKLLYKPILNVLEKRRLRVKESVEKAKEIEEKLTKTDLVIKEKRETARKEIVKLVEEAKREALEEKELIKKETQLEVEKTKNKLKEELKTEKDNLINEAQAEIKDLVIMLSKKLIKKEITDSRQKEIVAEIANVINNKASSHGSNR